MYKKWSLKKGKFDLTIDTDLWLIGITHKGVFTRLDFLCFSVEYWRNWNE